MNFIAHQKSVPFLKYFKEIIVLCIPATCTKPKNKYSNFRKSINFFESNEMASGRSANVTSNNHFSPVLDDDQNRVLACMLAAASAEICALEIYAGVVQPASFSKNNDSLRLTYGPGGAKAKQNAVIPHVSPSYVPGCFAMMLPEYVRYLLFNGPVADAARFAVSQQWIVLFKSEKLDEDPVFPPSWTAPPSPNDLYQDRDYAGLGLLMLMVEGCRSERFNNDALPVVSEWLKFAGRPGRYANEYRMADDITTMLRNVHSIPAAQRVASIQNSIGGILSKYLDSLTLRSQARGAILQAYLESRYLKLQSNLFGVRLLPKVGAATYQYRNIAPLKATERLQFFVELFADFFPEDTSRLVSIHPLGILLLAVESLLFDSEQDMKFVWARNLVLDTSGKGYLAALTCGWHALLHGFAPQDVNGLHDATYASLKEAVLIKGAVSQMTTSANEF